MAGSKQHGERETALIQQLWNAQAGLCFHCGKPMLRGDSQRLDRGRGWSKEHVHPKRTTGRGMTNNFVLAHPLCNGSRGCRAPTDEELSRCAGLYAGIGLVAFERHEDVAGRADVLRARRLRKAVEERQWVTMRDKRTALPLATIGDIWPSDLADAGRSGTEVPTFGLSGSSPDG